MKSLPFERHGDDLTGVLTSMTSTRANLGPQERIGSATLGAALLGYGLQRRDWLGMLTAAGGAALVLRGATGYCQVRDAMSRTHDAGDTRAHLAGSRGVNVCEAVTIQRSADDLYREWRRLEALPEKMQHIQSVEDLGNGRSRWVAKGPGGRQFEWEAEILEDIPGKLLSWKSLPGSDVVSAGSVNFDEVPSHGTRVTVRLQYAPPGGKLGAYVAWLLRQEPSQQIREDLREWKRGIEAGEVPTLAGQTSGRATS